MESKHTPLPWSIREHPANPKLVGFPHMMRRLPACEGGWLYFRNPEDAAFIIKACNSYYELEEALIEARDALSRPLKFELYVDGKKTTYTIARSKKDIKALTAINEVLS